MNPSTASTTGKMTLSSTTSTINDSNPTFTVTNFYRNLPLTSTGTSSNNYYFQPELLSLPPFSLNNTESLHTWTYPRCLTSPLKTNYSSDSSSSDFYLHNSPFHRYYPRILQKSSYQQRDEKTLLEKFHFDTSVNLDTGESKNIQQLTKNDFLQSAKQNRQYSSLLARVDYIGSVNKSTGKAELRFFIDAIGKSTTYYALQGIPFFVHQYSCWSSISPEHTHSICGLKCRQLECGDIIIAITEQQKSSLMKIDDKPDYSQQSPTKCLVERYMDGQLSSSNKRPKLSNE